MRAHVAGVVPWLLAACVGAAPPQRAAAIDANATLRAIAFDIEALRDLHPPLAGFAAATHLDPAGQRIDYAWHTHAAAPGAGWRAGVPEPGADGVWFHIDVHAPGSTRQLHTQPLAPAWCLGGQRVSLLVLEGATTGGIEGALQRIVQAHGVVRC